MFHTEKCDTTVNILSTLVECGHRCVLAIFLHQLMCLVLKEPCTYTSYICPYVHIACCNIGFSLDNVDWSTQLFCHVTSREIEALF